VIRVGEGWIVGQNLFMQWYIKNYKPVTAVSILTGNGATGEWRFNMADGMYLFFILSFDP